MDRRLLAGLIAAAVTASQAHAGPPPKDDFDQLVGASKLAMMAQPGQALKLAGQALDRAKGQAPDPQREVRIATAEWLEGEALLRLNRADDAWPLIQHALSVVAVRSPNTNLHGRLIMARGNLSEMRAQPEPALQDYQAAFRIFGAAKEPRGQAMALQNIGSIYQDAGDDAKVLQYYAQSAETYQGDPALLITAHNNIGRALADQGKLPQAIDELRKALAVAREMDSAVLEVRILSNLASIEVKAGRLAPAEGHAQEGLRLAAADAGAAEWRPYLWGVLAQSAARKGDPELAAQYLDKTFAGVDLRKTTIVYRDFHETAADVYERLGQDRRAIEHLRAFKRLDDEARKLTASANATLMGAQFDYANEQSRIAALKAVALKREVALANSRNTITRILLGGASLLAAMLMAGVTVLRRSRNQIRETNKSLEKAVQARTEFLAMTSHEIRTPLNGILGMTQVLLQDRTVAAKVRDRVSVIQAAGQAMLSLVDDILNMAKIESGNLVLEPAVFDLHGMLRETAKLWAEKAQAKGLAFSTDWSAVPTRVVEDGGALRQVVSNLLSNAIKFTDKGWVTLQASVERQDRHEFLMLRVSDSGIGIPEDRLEEVFEAFRQVEGGITRRFEGTGLGLAICRRTVRAMGGELELASTLGQGSAFTIRLPLVRVDDAPGAPAQHADADGLAECIVLVATPNPLAQSLLRAALQPEVRAVEVTAALDEALRALTVRRADLVLVDGETLGLGGRNGLANLEKLVSGCGGAMVAVLCAADTKLDDSRILAAGAAAVLRKPVAADELVARLKAEWRAPSRAAARGAAA
jgi:signal transduction histidine kinase/CheY-like chemotaxis protein